MKVDFAPVRLAHLIKDLEVHFRSVKAVTNFVVHAVIVPETVDLALHLFSVQGTNTPWKQLANDCASQCQLRHERSATVERMKR
jgi:hypothetical protein